MLSSILYTSLFALATPSIDMSLIDGHRTTDVRLEHRSVLAPEARFVVARRGGSRPMTPGRSQCWTARVGDDLLILRIGESSVNGLLHGPRGTRGVTREGEHLVVGGPVALESGLAPCRRRSDDVLLPARRRVSDGDAPPADRSMPAAGEECREVLVAVDTDWEFTQVFDGDVEESADYVATLFAAVSAIFEHDLHVVLTLTYVRVWEDDSDPYDTTEVDDDYLDQFTNEWNSNAPTEAADRHVAHLLSGSEDLDSAGYAWVGETCDTSRAYAYSSSLEGGWWSWNPWDLLVVAHEIGHTVGADHTHDMVPPIDECGNGNCSDPEGTIMSYCHICPGGYSNITLEFHPRVREDIWSHLAEQEFQGWCTLGVERSTDIDDNGLVDVEDLGRVITDFAVCSCCPADTDASGAVDIVDILGVLSDWSP